MKNIIIPIAFLLLANTMQAQSSAPRLTEEQKQEAIARFEAYKQELRLTEEQSARVEQINLDYFEALAPVRNSGDSKLSKYRKYKDLNAEKDRRMKEVLDDEQYEIYRRQQEARKAELREKRGRG